MWAVEVIIDWRDKTTERYEGLTAEQAKYIHRREYAKGYPMVRSYKMEQ